MYPIVTTDAPKAIGPYSQGISAGGLIFVSGQLGIDPETGELVAGGIEEQTHQVLRNISAILSSASAGLAGVVKTTVYLKDLKDFPAMNAVYAEFFDQNLPARATVQVSALPKGALVEIDCIAVMA
jgi:2-iminobutanoate/2-iminopropanoate deaminase